MRKGWEKPDAAQASKKSSKTKKASGREGLGCRFSWGWRKGDEIWNVADCE